MLHMWISTIMKKKDDGIVNMPIISCEYLHIYTNTLDSNYSLSIIIFLLLYKWLHNA